MPVESATYLNNLDSTYPLGSDKVKDGDNHLRLIKSVLKATFPGVDGSGFKKAVTATEDELNFVSGVTSPIQTQLTTLSNNVATNLASISSLQSSLSAPVGTKMAFFQGSAPSGWTQDTAHNNKLLRVVSTAGGGSGGTDSPISWGHTHTTASHAVTVDEMPSHSHKAAFGEHAGGIDYGTNHLSQNASSTTSGRVFEQDTQAVGGGGAHEHGATGESTFSPLYVDMIIASKD